jgi:Tol biopolymer transport system component
MKDPERDLRAMMQSTADGLHHLPQADSGLVRRARLRRAQTVMFTGVAAVALVFGGFAVRSALSTDATPAPPAKETKVELGIFEPIAGQIVYYANSGLQAVDPNAQSPVATQLNLGPEKTTDRQFAAFTAPLGWSSDGTKLLVWHEDPTDDTFPYARHLFILHADGTETQVTSKPVEDAAISPDGERVVFAAEGKGLYLVDVEDGQTVRIAEEGATPTFSPDGTQIAYLGLPRRGCCVKTGREHVWVANADGTDAHEILEDEPALDEGGSELTWSPAGNRIAMENSRQGHVAIYTFAPDGSDFTKVITGGFNLYWSPDGSQFVYGRPARDGVSLADADGSNVQELSFGGPGPWHPGTLETGGG